jgi:hypothetical protein
MPAHARTQVRAGARALLGALPTTGDRAHIGRTRPLAEGHDPALLIYGRETVTRVAEQGEPPTLLHDLTLFVEGRVSVAKTADADQDPAQETEELLDLIELEVTGALLAADAFAALDPPVLIHMIELRRSTLAAQAPGSRHEGELRLEFGVQFYTPEDDLSSFA